MTYFFYTVVYYGKIVSEKTWIDVNGVERDVKTSYEKHQEFLNKKFMKKRDVKPSLTDGWEAFDPDSIECF